MKYYTSQSLFEKTREYFREVLDLDLSLIELVHLKEYCAPVLKDSEIYEYSPLSEMVHRFIAGYYGIDLSAHFIQNIIRHDTEVFKQYLRIIQEQSHKP